MKSWSIFEYFVLKIEEQKLYKQKNEYESICNLYMLITVFVEAMSVHVQRKNDTVLVEATSVHVE